MMMNLAKSVTLEKTETDLAKGLFPVSARERKYTLTIFLRKEWEPESVVLPLAQQRDSQALEPGSGKP
jgi:hypothetical protein